MYRRGDPAMVWTDNQPEPKRRRGHYLVRVLAAAVNPFDYKLLDMAPMRISRRNTPVGMELAGYVEHAPPGANHAVGDLVFAHNPKEGALAELVNVPTQTTSAIPHGMKPSVATATPHAGTTALRGLEDYAGAERALIIGASGGVGTFAVQIAKALSIGHVTAVCSKRNTELVTSLGADTILAYDTPGFALPNDACPAGSIDVVLDCVTSKHTLDYEHTARATLRPGGTYIATESPRTSDLIRAAITQNTPLRIERRHYRHLITQATGHDLYRLGAWLTDGQLRPVIADTVVFSDDNCRAAFDQLRTQRTIGKIVITMPGPTNPGASL